MSEEKGSESLEKTINDTLDKVRKSNVSKEIKDKVEEMAKSARKIVEDLKLKGE